MLLITYENFSIWILILWPNPLTKSQTDPQESFPVKSEQVFKHELPLVATGTVSFFAIVR